MKLNNVASRREFLKTIPTQELDEILQAELRKENIDDDLVRLILDVLEEREADRPVEISVEVATAVEKYTTYLDGLGKEPAKPTRRWSVVLKVASALVVVGLLFFVVPQAANAENFFEMLARWTDSIFEFFSPGDDNKQPEYVFETDHPGLQQIYDAVVELGVTEPVVPMWVPEEYELLECKTTSISRDKSVHAVLSNERDTIFFRVSIIDTKNGVNIYKDELGVITYEHNGTTHYIMQNLNRQIATWNTEKNICSVAVDCQEDILFEILKSIYTTEED